ncbi:MAG: hypothetical protein NC124_03245 [Clostridium sp.]|nr:hypothetical protein [Clostridium sp.]
MEHTVKKNRANRLAMRFVACVFILVAVLRFVVVVTSEEKKSAVVTVILCCGCLSYGIYLLCQTFREQAYDITYVFGEKAMTLKTHRRQRVIGYDEITDLGFVTPNENMDCGIVQLYIGKEQYVLPFLGESQVGNALYGMLKIKREEAENTAEEKAKPVQDSYTS